MPFPSSLLGRLRRGYFADSPDTELLRAFADTRDDDAFRALIERHGPMVLRTCRAVLRDDDAADDAFQATFLVLARKAAGVAEGRAGGVGGWLYQTARRVAMKARTTRARQLRREAAAATPEVRVEDLSARELLAVLDEEIDRLPAPYRMALVLCYWQGLTQDEAARRLGVSPGSIKGRLERGRATLAERLKRRGFGPPVLLLATAGTIAVPAQLLASTAALPAGSVPAAVAELARAAAPSAMRRVAVGLVVTLIGAIGVAVCYSPAPTPPPPAKPQAAEAADPLPAGAVARFGTTRFRSDTWAEAVDVSPDGKTLAVVGRNHIFLWDTATGTELRRFGPVAARRIGNGEFSARFVRVAFSPNGATLAAATEDQSGQPSPILQFDVATGRQLGEFVGHAMLTRSLAFLSDGRSLVSAELNEVRITDTTTGTAVRTLGWEGGFVSRMAVSPDRRRVFISGSKREATDGSWEVWDATTATLQHRETGVPSTSIAGAFSPDGETLALCLGIRPADRDDGKTEIRLFDLTAKKERRRWDGHAGAYPHVVSTAFSTDGKTVATGGADHVVRQWSAETGQATRPAIHPYRHATSVGFLPDGTLYTHGAQNTVRFWDAATGKPARRVEGHDAHLEALAVSADGRTVASGGGGGDASVRLWDVATGRLHRVITGGMFDVTAVAFSPDGATVAGAGSNGTVTLWGTSDGRVRRELKGHKGWVRAVAFSPDGRTLATGDENNVVRLWDAAAGTEVRQLKGEMPAAVVALAFSPDGQTLYSAGWDHAIRQWDLATGKLVRTIKGGQGPRGSDDSTGHTSVVTSLSLSRDGRRLASGSYDHTIRIWDTATGQLCRMVRGPNRDKASSVRTVALSPDGALLAAAADEDGRRHLIDVWDLRTGQRLAPLDGHRSQVTVLAFTPDGRRLASVSTDTTGLLWDVSTLRTEPAAASLDSLWTDLEGNAVAGYDAVQRGIAAGDRTVALLRERLKPAAPTNTQRVAELIEALASPRFAERDKASRELEALGPGIEGALRKALTDDRPAEARSRIESILKGLAARDQRTIRAVEILEGIGTPAARALLTDLAAGADGARLTHEAAAGVKRLDQR